MQSNERSVLGQTLFEIAWWPAWWYGHGFLRVSQWAIRQIREQEIRLGVSLWWRNLFTPMYGQYDWQGRIISFIVRFFNGILRSIAWFAWIVMCVLVGVAWLVIPIVIIFGVSYQLTTLYVG